MLPTFFVNQRFVVHPQDWWTRWRNTYATGQVTQRDNNNNNLVLIYFNIFIAQLTTVFQITMQY